MATGCMAAATWILSRSINWEAWSAIGTVSATMVALFLPWKVGRKERAKEVSSHREIASAVDRVLAYHEAAIALYKAEPVYNVGMLALKKIGLNAQTLLDLLRLLQVRPGLSDGALYSALAAQQIASEIVETTSAVVDHWGVRDPKWFVQQLLLERHEQLAAIIKQRLSGVRRTFNLKESDGATQIRAKYLSLAAAIKLARKEDTEEPAIDLDTSYY